MNRIKFFVVTLFSVFILLKGFSIEKSSEHEIDVFRTKLSSVEVRLENSNYLKNLTNRLANPCQHFIEYACGNFSNLTFNSNSASTRELKKKYTSSVLTFSQALTKNLDGYENYQPVTAEDKYKMYYSSCLHQSEEKTPYFEEIFKVLEPYGGIPFRNPNWKSDNFDWMKFSAFAMRFNIPTLFEAVPNFQNFINNRQFGIEIRNINKYVDWEKHQEFMVKILKSSGIASETVAETVNKIISFKKALLEIEGGDIESMTMKDLITKYSEINWKSFFSTLFDKIEADLDLSEVIRVERNDFIKNIVELISNTKPEIVANYMGWEFLEAVIKFHDNDYLNKFENLISLELKEQNDNLISSNKYFDTQCFREQNYFLTPILVALFLNNYYDNKVDDNVVEMAYEIKSALQNLLEENDWIGNDTGAAFDYLNLIKFKVASPNILSIKELNDFYASLKVTPKNYIENWFNSRKFQTMKIYAKTDYLDMGMSPPLAHYELDSHVFKIPFLYLMTPYFHSYLPNGLKFSKMGLSIALELIRYSPVLESRPGNWKIKSEEFWNCYKKEFDIVQSPDYDVGLHSFIALQSSLDAFDKKMSKLNKSGNDKLDEYDFTENQLFFLNAARNYCNSNGKNFKLLSAFFANIDKFAEAFSCPHGSPMNPIVKCKFNF